MQSAVGRQRQRGMGGTGEVPEARLRQRHPPQHIRHLLSHGRLRHALQAQARCCHCRACPKGALLVDTLRLHLPASALLVIP
jgi:hypothetical protein